MHNAAENTVFDELKVPFIFFSTLHAGDFDHTNEPVSHIDT